MDFTRTVLNFIKIGHFQLNIVKNRTLLKSLIWAKKH